MPEVTELMWTAGTQVSDIHKDEVGEWLPFYENGMPSAVIAASPDATYTSKCKRKQ